jgi:aspartyl-tRNA(Asn)/glutamyl-tRNA(Gln) amidotransferase subunit A
MLNKSLRELNKSFTTGDVSAEEIVSYYLNRIEKYDGKLGCFLSVFKDRAQKCAHQLDKKRKSNKKLGRLAGIPIALKDNMNVKGEITTCGSKFLENYRSPFDSTLARLLEEEDAILIGKTNMDEFAMGSSNEKSAFFPTKNPWDLSCVPGGSSGGSTAAVAARLVPASFGSDTGGSIRQPASLCGVVGFKPTYGRVSRYGLVAFGSSLDQIGPLTTNIKDTGLIMEVIGKHCEKDSTSLNLPQEKYFDEDIDEVDFSDVKIGVPWHFLENLKEKEFNYFKKSIDKIKELGGQVIDINLDVLKYSVAVYYILATAEASTNLARFDGIRYGLRSSAAKNLDEIYDLSREEGFGPEVKKRIMLGTYVLSAGYQNAFYKKAQRVRRLMITAYEDAFSKCDLVAMPTAPGPAFEIGAIQDPLEMYLQDIFTISANLAGLPAISIPTGFSEDKKPLSLQLQGPQMHDVSVIRHGAFFEKAIKFYNNIPPLFTDEVRK